MKNKIIYIFIQIAFLGLLIFLGIISFNYVANLESIVQEQREQIKDLSISNDIINQYFHKKSDTLSHTTTYTPKNENVIEILVQETDSARYYSRKETHPSVSNAYDDCINEYNELQSEYNQMTMDNHILNSVIKLLKKYVDFEYSVVKNDSVLTLSMDQAPYSKKYNDLIVDYNSLSVKYNELYKENRTKQHILDVIIDKTGIEYSLENKNDEHFILTWYKHPTDDPEILKIALEMIQEESGLVYTFEKKGSDTKISIKGK